MTKLSTLKAHLDNATAAQMDAERNLTRLSLAVAARAAVEHFPEATYIGFYLDADDDGMPAATHVYGPGMVDLYDLELFHGDTPLRSTVFGAFANLNAYNEHYWGGFTSDASTDENLFDIVAILASVDPS